MANDDNCKRRGARILLILNGCQSYLPQEPQPALEQTIPSASALELNKPGIDYICEDREPNIDTPPPSDPVVLGETQGKFPALCPSGKVPRSLVKFDGPPKILPPRPPSLAAMHLTDCRYGFCYAHASSYQSVVALGIRADLTQHSPEVNPNDNGHSIAEMALIKGYYPYQNIVEVGWRKRPDDVTRLFVFWWVNGTKGCYNQECSGWVQYSSSVYPGMAISDNISGIRYVIQRRLGSDNWWIAWNGIWMGYYPASLWNGQFLQSNEIQFYGEVASIDSVTKTDMGNGLWSNNNSAAKILYQHYLIDLRGVWRGAVTTKFSEATDYYTVTETAANGMRYGGPGCTSGC